MPLAVFDRVAAGEEHHAEAADALEEYQAVGRGFAGGHPGVEQRPSGPVALLELPAGFLLGGSEGLLVVAVRNRIALNGVASCCPLLKLICITTGTVVYSEVSNTVIKTGDKIQ